MNATRWELCLKCFEQTPTVVPPEADPSLDILKERTALANEMYAYLFKKFGDPADSDIDP